MSLTFLGNYVTGRQHFTKVKVNRWLSFIWKKCKETKQTF